MLLLIQSHVPLSQIYVHHYSAYDNSYFVADFMMSANRLACAWE
jgi:hypothetical protein